MPRVLGYGREGTLEYILMTRIPGVAVAQTALAGEPRVVALRALGRVVAQVHRVPQTPLRDSGLFPGDCTPADFLGRLETSFASVATALAGRPETADIWSGDLAPDALARSVREVVAPIARGGRIPLVALHTNPGATHTFVDDRTGQFTGLIDFGDAYTSHPAFDLLRWTDAGDRTSVLDGYAAAAGPTWVDMSFLATWRALSILADLQAAARRPEHAADRATQVRATLALLHAPITT